MKHKKNLTLALAFAVFSTVSVASEIAPEDVPFNASMQVTDSISGKAGDATEGRKVFANRKLGNCLACHAASDQTDQLFHGEVGPNLDGVATRYPEGLLRTLVINAKKVFSDSTVMPGFYTKDLGERVAEKFKDKTILTAQQVEDVVAYLMTFK